MGDVAQLLAEFVAQTGFAGLPGESVKRARHCFLDLAAVALRGSRQDIASLLVDKYAPIFYPEQKASLIGFARKTAVPVAAFLNAAMGHVLDFDDIKAKIGHPSVTIVPAVLAMGEHLGSTGKEALTAFILGVEVSSKVADWLEPEQTQRGWHATCSSGIFGVAAATAKLLGLDSDQLRNAFGLAAGFASGLRRNFGTPTKAVQVGKAAENGLNAALFAQTGISADPSIFTGENGFAAVFSGDRRSEDFPGVLGDPFEVMLTGFKLYPCCASAHTAVDAVRMLRNEEPIPTDKILKVRVGTVPINIDNLVYTSPRNPSEAKFSMQFCVAIALLEGKVQLEHFSKRWIEDPRVQSLMPRITMHHHPDLASLGYRGTENSIVEIELQDGSKRSTRVDIPRGHPDNPLGEDELVDKYTLCATGILSPQALAESYQKILTLESEESLGPLMCLLSGTAVQSGTGPAPARRRKKQN